MIKVKTKPLKYLCTVYTINEGGLEMAYIQAATALGKMLKRGERVFCPIAHCHTAAQLTDIPTNFDWWMDFDEGWIDKCDEVVVLMMPNWKKSKGITHEIKYAKETGKPVKYLTWPALKYV